MKLYEILYTIIHERLDDAVEHGDISVSDYDHAGFIDGTTFKTDGGELSIGKYSHQRPYGVIELFVDEEFRRRGIATKLIKFAMKYFADGFIAQVSNESSLNLHYKLGFRSFDSDLNIQSFDESKKRLVDNTSVGMASPKLLSKLDKYYK